jgi:dynein heavy chain 1
LADQGSIASYLKKYFRIDGLVTKCLEQAVKYEHIMDFTRLRALGSMFTMLNQAIRNVLWLSRLNKDVKEKYISKSLILAILWSFSGDCKLEFRCELGK